MSDTDLSSGVKTNLEEHVSAIEKTNLEAHVEISSHRFYIINDRLTRLEHGMMEIVEAIDGIRKDNINQDKCQNERIISWGASIISALAGVVGWLIATYVVK